MPEISHLITHGNGDGTLSLFFTAAEFVEYFQKNRICYGFNLDEQAAAEVYSATAGHPTLVSLVLRYVRLHVIQETANTPQSTMLTITKPDLLAIMHDEDRLFNCLGDKIYPGSYARDSKVVVNLFRKLLQAPDGKIGWESAARSTIEKCFLNNLIVHEIDQAPPHAEWFRFPSPLHARWAQWYHHIETGVYAGELTP